MDYQFELVGKIGSMALIRKEDQDIDYNIFSRLGRELKPGMISDKTCIINLSLFGRV